MIEDQPTGLNRRDVLRRGAILGGALVWTVPAVQTLAGPAFAAGTPCVGRFEFTDDRGTCLFVQFNADTTCCDCVTTFVAANPSLPAAVLLAGAFCTISGACTIQSAGTC
ncbi:MAG: hypothetical protein M3211_02430 [Actinomycetota bacterium]|nr:hypothetical protein [Actinomycetota bacterium]